MAKKVNPFAEDFQNINKAADEKVLEFLTSSDSKVESKPSPSKTKKVFANRSDKDPLTAETKTTPVKKQPKPKVAKIEAMEWGKPIALFNTRIPERMSELLDDLAYKRKKQGMPCTKQAIAIEALESYLKQEGILRCS